VNNFLLGQKGDWFEIQLLIFSSVVSTEKTCIIILYCHLTFEVFASVFARVLHP